MAAPSNTVWGNVITGSKSTRKGKIGISISTSDSNTARTVTVQVWYWSMYSLSDTNNTLYANWDTTSATTSQGSKSISCSVATGSGWSTSNQVLLATYSKSYSRGTSSATKYFAAKITGIDNHGSGNVSSCYVSFTIPALPSYTVSYNANGGSGAPGNQTKYYGVSLTISSTKPTRSGYTFMGWSLGGVSESVYYTPGSSCGRNENVYLYAVWRKQLTLSYNANGGSGAPGSSSAYIYNATTNKAFTLSSTKPTRTGYTFLGWSTSSGATSATYAAGGSITISSNTTLYAVWKINSYVLTIKPNGGKWNGSANDSTATQNYNTTKSIADPIRDGYTFTRWALDGSGSLSGKTYTYGAGAGTLTAQWDINEYNVMFDAGTNEGTVDGLEKRTLTYEYGTKLGTLPIPVRKNYTFLGWFTSASGGTQITSDYIVTGNVTVYAQFEIDASAYVNASEVWRTGVTFVSDGEGNVRKGHAKTNVNGVWKDGYCN